MKCLRVLSLVLTMCMVASAQTPVAVAPAPPPLIVTGPEDPRLAPFDQLMTQFVTDHQVPGAQLAVARGGRLIYARGFGFADVPAKEPVAPNAMFRIASVTKMFTSAAIMQLVQEGKLKLDDPWYPIVGIHPLPGQRMDPRLTQITIAQLLQHRGGWDRDKSFDPMFRPVVIAKAIGIQPPADQQAIIQYMLGVPLDFSPGDRMAYSNFGYCILGRVIERISHQPYERYVQRHVLSPLGIRHMELGRTLPRMRAPGEVKYYDGDAACVFPPNITRQVPAAYGGWNLEAMDSHGGWIASAPELVRFAVSFDQIDASPILSSLAIRQTFARPPGAAGFEPDGRGKPVWYGFGWSVRAVGPRGQINTWHNGRLDGTSSLLVRRSDGLAWAVLFNAAVDQNKKALSDLIDPLVHQAADSVRDWPSGRRDLFPEMLR